jgi:hypothetical protein
VWERAKFEGVDDKAARMMWRTMGGLLESMRTVGSTGVEFDDVDIDDTLPRQHGSDDEPMFGTVDDESDGQMMSRMMVMFESMRRDRREVPSIEFDDVDSGDVS